MDPIFLRHVHAICCNPITLKKQEPIVSDASSIKEKLMDEKFVSDESDSFLQLTPCGASECLDYVDAAGSTGFEARVVMGEGKLGARSFPRRSCPCRIFLLEFSPVGL